MLTEHGCILIASTQEPEDSRTPKGKGEGKTSKGGGWLLGGRPFQQPAQAPDATPVPCNFASAQADPHGPIQSGSSISKDSSRKTILEKGLNSMREDIKDQAERQKASRKELNERVNGVESALTGQLAQFMSNLQSRLAQQKNELSGQIQSGHDNPRSKLTTELRSQTSAIRKRTPSPSPGQGGRQADEGKVTCPSANSIKCINIAVLTWYQALQCWCTRGPFGNLPTDACGSFKDLPTEDASVLPARWGFMAE